MGRDSILNLVEKFFNFFFIDLRMGIFLVRKSIIFFMEQAPRINYTLLPTYERFG